MPHLILKLKGREPLGSFLPMAESIILTPQYSFHLVILDGYSKMGAQKLVFGFYI